MYEKVLIQKGPFTYEDGTATFFGIRVVDKNGNGFVLCSEDGMIDELKQVPAEPSKVITDTLDEAFRNKQFRHVRKIICTPLFGSALFAEGELMAVDAVLAQVNEEKTAVSFPGMEFFSTLFDSAFELVVADIGQDSIVLADEDGNLL